jgi:uridine kinase
VTTLDDLVALVQERRGLAPFVVAIEGLGGAGKSTLAAHLALAINDSAVVPMDDFLIKEMVLHPRNEEHYDLLRLEREVLIPFTQGLPFNYGRLDWAANKIEPIDGMIDSTLIILEGICSYHPQIEYYVNLKVWVSAPVAVATKRGLARDAETENAAHWKTWRNCDIAYCAEFDPATRADLIISGV